MFPIGGPPVASQLPACLRLFIGVLSLASLFGEAPSISSWLAAPGARAVRGDEPAHDAAAFGYRRVMVRPEQIPELARGYLPVSRVEFEQLLQAVQNRLPSAAPVTRIVTAEYVARWTANQTWTGRGLLTVQHHSDQRGALLWEPCSLPFYDARWRPVEGGRASAAAPPRRDPVQLGLNPRGQLTLLVDQPGVLDHAWSLAGQVDSSGQTQFAAELPRAAVARLWVELPVDRTLRAEGGAALAGPLTDLAELGASKSVLEAAQSLTARSDASGGLESEVPRDGRVMTPRVDLPGGADATDRRWWRVDLGGQDEWVVQVAPADVAVARTPTVVWKQDVQYEVTLSGLELRSALRFDVPAAPLRQLALSMPAELHVGSIRWGDASLRWTAQPANDDGWREVVVDLPDLTGVDRVLHVTALAAVVVGQPWTLPMLQCRGQAWQETRATVNVVEPLIVQAMDAVEGRQTQVAAVAAPAPATSGQFQFHSPGGAPRLHVALPPTQVDVVTGVSFDLDATAASVRVAAAFDVKRGQLFRVTADLPSAWLVDGVEMTPESIMEDFELTATDDPLRQRLSIRLRSPLARGESARLTLRAHRPRTTTDEPLDADDFRLLTFVSGGVAEYRSRRLVGVHAEAANRFRIRGDVDVRWLTRDRLTPMEADLLDEESALAFVEDPSSAALQITPETSTTSFSAQIQIGVRVAAAQIHEEYAIRCDPRGTNLNRLLILFSHARAAPLAWSIEGEPDAILSARRLADAERNALTRAAGEAWELLFRKSRNGPFQVTASRDGPWTGPLPVALASLPDADFQDGTIRIEGVDVRPIVDHDEVETLPIATAVTAVNGTVAAAFRYDPANARPISVAPPAPAARGPEAWAWKASLTTICRESGELRHDATWQIENRSATRIEVALPAGSQAANVLIDEKPWTGAPSSRPAPNRWIVPLVPGRRFTTIRVAYLTRGRPLASCTRVAPEWPTLDVPVFARTWHVRVPTTFRLHAPQALLPAGQPTRASGWTTDVADRWLGLLWNANDAAGEQVRAASPSGLTEVALSSPWSDASRAAADLRERSWRSYAFVAPDDADWSVDVEYRLRGEAWGWALLVFTAGALATVGRRYTAWLAGMLPLTAGAALVVDADWAAPASGVFLGALLAAGLHWVARPRLRPRQWPVADGSTTATLAATSGALVCAMLGCLSGAFAQEAAAPVRPRVLIATDDAGKPVDDYVHLPRDFYHDLRQRARGLTRPLPEWLLTSARYRAAIREEASALGWDAPAVEAAIDVELLSPDQRVVLPVGHAMGTLLSHQVSRNGESIDASIEASAEGWVIPLRETGIYTITLMLRPRVGPIDARGAARGASTAASPGTVGGTAAGMQPGATGGAGAGRHDRGEGLTTGFVLETPRISDCRLVVEAPGADWSATIPAGIGRISRENAGREYQREVGPVSQLVVGIRPPEGNTASAPLVEWDDLSWLRIRPGAVTYEVQWTFQTSNLRLPRVLRFAIDPRLRLVTTMAGAPLKRPLAPTSDGAAWELEWDDTVGARQSLRATFALSNASGIGRLRLPRVQALDAAAIRRWTAVSVAPQMEVSRWESPTLTPPTWDEFQKDWGAEDASPQTILRLAANETETGVLVTYRVPQTMASASLDLSVGAHDVRWHYEAELQTSVAPVFEHQLRVPDFVTVRDVAIAERDEESNRVVRWARTANGLITVLFASPVSGNSRLSVDGEFSADRARMAAVPIPSIELATAETATTAVRVYQRSDARVAVRRADGGEVPAATAEYRDGWGRLAAADVVVPTDGTIPGESPWPTIEVSPNDVRASGTLVTTLLRMPEGYVAGVAAHVALRAGRLDQLRIEIPEDWGDEILVNPPTPMERVRSAGQARQYLVLRPEQPWTSSFDLQLIGPSIGSRDERLAVPDLRFPDWDDVERYVWLPLRDRQRRIVWELSGLQATQLPAHLPVRTWPGLESRNRSAAKDATETTADDAGSAGADEPIQVAYRVVGTRFRAAIREVEGDSGLSRVLLADHFLTLGPGRECWGASQFDVAAGNLDSCEFSLPAGLELVDVRRDQLPAASTSVAAGRWRLELASSAWPQRVTLVYRGNLADGEKATDRLPHPEMLSLPTLQSLWSVALLPGVDATWTAPQAASISPLEQNLLRLRTINEIVDYGSDALFHAGPNELRDWFEPWSKRRALLAQRSRAQWTTGGEVAQAWKDRFDELDGEYEQVRQSFEAVAAGLPAVTAADGRAGRDAADVWQVAAHEPAPGTLLTLRGDVGETSVAPVRAAPLPSAPRRILACCLFLAAPTVWYALRKDSVREWFARWPQVVLAAVGLIACAAFPAAPWWGLVLVVLAILAAVRSPWTVRRAGRGRRDR